MDLISRRLSPGRAPRRCLPVVALRFGLVAFAFGCGTDPEESTTGELVVAVTDASTGAALDGVSVTVAGDTRLTSGGVATFAAAAAGAHQVTATLEGYTTGTLDVVLPAGERLEVTIVLAPDEGPPGAPQGLLASAIAVGTVELSWQSVAGATGYRVYWAMSPGVAPGSGTLVDVPPQPNFSPLLHFDCPAAGTCYAIVTAVNAAGEGPPSIEVSVRAGAVMGFQITTSFRGSTSAPNGVLPGDTIGVSVTVTSATQVVQVTVSAAGHSAVLTPVPGTSRWEGVLLLTGVPRGPVALTATAKDISGAVASFTEPAYLDRLPVLRVIEPADWTVARPTLHVKVECVEDGPWCAVSIGAQDANFTPAIVRVSSAPVDQDITFTDGTLARLTVAVEDSAGNKVSRTLTIPIEPSSRLRDVAEAPGRILDASADRLLYVVAGAAGDSVVVRNRASGQDAAASQSAAVPVTQGWLTPGGAAFVRDPDGPAELFEWRGGGLPVSLGVTTSSEDVHVAGPWLLWRNDRQLFRRDVVAGTTVTLATDYNGAGSDVAPGGDVVYTRDGDIVLVHNGGATQVTSDGTSPDDDAPAVDDVHLVYRTGLVAPSGRFIRLDDGATDVTLSGPLPPSEPFPPPQAENGWIGYVKESGTVDQVWVRSPAGADRQASATGLTGAVPETLSPEGAVFFRVQGRRFLAAPPFDGAAVEVGTGEGRGVFIDGDAYVILGRSVLRVE